MVEQRVDATNPSSDNRLTTLQKTKITAVYAYDALVAWTPRQARLGRALLGLGVVTGLPAAVVYDNYNNGPRTVTADPFSSGEQLTPTPTMIPAPTAIPARISLIPMSGADCSAQGYGFSVGFVDNPIKPNRLGLIDTVDFAISNPNPGALVVTQLQDPNNLNSARMEVARVSLIPHGDHSSLLFNLNIKTHTRGVNGKPAAEIRYFLEDDKIRQADNPSLPPEGTAVVECGEIAVLPIGRQVTQDMISTQLLNPNGIKSVGGLLNESFSMEVGRGLGTTPAGDNPAENADLFRRFVDEIRRRADAVRAKERGNIPPTATPTMTSTPSTECTPTKGNTCETPTATPIITSTPTQTFTPTATFTATPTFTPTPGGGKGRDEIQAPPEQLVAGAKSSGAGSTLLDLAEGIATAIGGGGSMVAVYKGIRRFF